MDIKFNDLSKQWQDIKGLAKPRIETLLYDGQYIGGPEVENFEKNFAAYTNQDYAIGVSNGTDGLKLAIQTLLNGITRKTNIIIPANTFIADALAIHYQKGKVFTTLIDCDDFYVMDPELLVKHLFNNRKNYDDCIIMPVHLYGHPCDMVQIAALAEKYDCKIIEDASQAHGSRIHNPHDVTGFGLEGGVSGTYNPLSMGNYADMTVYSCYPGKNLGAAGDAGIIITDNEHYADKLKSLRNYGSSKKYEYDYPGWNNRLDPIQAIILDEKLKLLNMWNTKKAEIAKTYDSLLQETVITPITAPYVDFHSRHIYAIRSKDRDGLQKYLAIKGIPTIIHYPVPLYLTEPFKHLDSYHLRTYKYSKELLSLPMHPFLTEEEVKYICEAIIEYETVKV
jgi:dTDP-4-amino-4,6-dideoxygalactose transaminase